jgi:hypothetical protein
LTHASGLCYYFYISIFCIALRKQNKIAHFGDSQHAAAAAPSAVHRAGFQLQLQLPAQTIPS